MPGRASVPQPILEIYREPLRPGCEAAYAAIESETARRAAALGCPHPYLGAESIAGSPEVWWFNSYESPAQRAEVADAYANNAALMAALQDNSRKKAPLTLAPVDTIAFLRQDVSVGRPWTLGIGRFLVVAVTTGESSMSGTVFETDAGVRYVIIAAQTLDAAREACRAAATARALAVRAAWSFPAREWIAADPEFWQSHVGR